MQLTAGVTIENTDTVTRQTLFDLIGNALTGLVQPTDFDGSVLSILTGSTVTVGITPGTILYDKTELLWKCFYDVIDNTGVSLWLAFGPDRFDEAFLAVEPIPRGAAVRLTGGGRRAGLSTGYLDSGVIALNQADGTTASGTWFPGAVEGYATAWFPFKTNSTDTGQEGSTAAARSVFPISWTLGGLGSSTSGNNNNGWIVGITPTQVAVPASGDRNTRSKILFHGPRFVNTP